jgi:hypothetical protein
MAVAVCLNPRDGLWPCSSVFEREREKTNPLAANRRLGFLDYRNECQNRRMAERADDVQEEANSQ